MILLWMTLAFAAGAVFWTFLEYAIHGWMGHAFPNKTEFSREHLAHHKKNSYFTPNLRKTRAALLVLVPVAVASGLIMGWAIGISFTLGIGACYVLYEVVHRRIHTHAPRGFYSRWARRNHLYHHFKDPRTNHGVTTPIWDIVFGTYRRPGQIRVPRHNQMDWLCDGETGQVKPEYTLDYVLR